MEVTIGIDIGGTNSAYGVVDGDANIIVEGKIPTAKYPDVDDFVEAMSAELNNALKKAGDVKLVGIGIGAPNGNYYKGTIEQAPNLAWKGIVPLADKFKQKFNLPVALTNDANAAAIGEMIYGGGKGMKNFIVLTLGTGLGSGIIVNGELVYGCDGFAGELGHTTVYHDGRECGCGRNGCLETYVSATAIVRTAFDLLADSQKPSKLREIAYKDLTSKDIYDAAMEGDELAQECFEITGEILGNKICDFVAFSSPEAIFLFGGLALAGDILFNPVKKAFDEHVQNIFKGKCKILPSELNDKNGAILGSAALAWKELDS
jgi:glucokinase